MTISDRNDGDRGNWHINLDAAFAVTSIGGSRDVADMRMFYWTTGQGNTAVLKHAVFSTRGRGYGKRGGNDNHNNNHNNNSGRWRAGKLFKSVPQAGLSGLAATSWIKDGKVGRAFYYIQGGYLKELTLDDSVDDDHWEDGDHDGVELHYTPGEMSAVFWIDGKGVLNKRIYAQNEDTKEVATPLVETNAAASAASLQVPRGKPTLYLWSLGPGGGDVKEEDDTHGSNALAGTALSATATHDYGGLSYVFFINQECHLTQFNRGPDSHWHENVGIQVGADH
ncbi:hypothetical protein FS837_008960 [Tulasnella sp. UAMH 9824]|nr:hypothetical protein FS837_008960 [Tulasnella sp. UAMH 9824]